MCGKRLFYVQETPRSEARPHNVQRFKYNINLQYSVYDRAIKHLCTTGFRKLIYTYRMYGYTDSAAMIPFTADPVKDLHFAMLV